MITVILRTDISHNFAESLACQPVLGAVVVTVMDVQLL